MALEMTEIQNLIHQIDEENYDIIVKRILLLSVEEVGEIGELNPIRDSLFEKLSGFTNAPEKKEFNIYFNKRIQDTLIYMSVPHFISQKLEEEPVNLFTYINITRDIVKQIITTVPEEDRYAHLQLCEKALYNAFQHIDIARIGWDNQFSTIVAEQTAPIIEIGEKHSFLENLQIEDFQIKNESD